MTGTDRPGRATLELVVLGSSGSHTGPGQVCSGYLVRAGGVNVLVDAGNGSTANLQRVVGFRELDAVVISHRHVDHCIDLVGMYYALRFDPEFAGPLTVYAPADVYDTLTSVISSDSTFGFDEVFAFHEVRGGDRVTIGELSVTLFDAEHPVPAVSMRFEAAGRVLAYSGDSAGGDELVACARGADLFLCEATWQGDAGAYPPGIHLVATEAGTIATSADARRLVLTHVAGGLDRRVSREEASRTFDGPVEVAEPLARWVLA